MTCFEPVLTYLGSPLGLSTPVLKLFWGIFGHCALIAAQNCANHLQWLSSPLAARRYVRSTSAASRRDAKRAKFKVQVPNIASKAFLSLKNLALKAYLKVRLEISDLGRPAPILNPSPQARTDRKARG